MNAFVDPELCIGCTQCAGLCPAVFHMEGVLAVAEPGPIPPEDAAARLEAYEIIRTALGSFLFTQDEVFKTVDCLSGGEKVRLSLVKLMLSKPNFLMLDEPTNHLDLLGKEALEESLGEY